MKKKEIILIVILVFILLFLIAFFVVKTFNRGISIFHELKEKYDISSAVVIDTRVTVSRSGTPCYYFIYKFPNGEIYQKQVTVEEYYIYFNNLSE